MCEIAMARIIVRRGRREDGQVTCQRPQTFSPDLLPTPALLPQRTFYTVLLMCPYPAALIVHPLQHVVDSAGTGQGPACVRRLSI